ncbi:MULTISPECIES: type II toxin-antitoxin system Phd/YefM family antitoxin [Limnospira]|uniref:Antitoxin n=2 Tax=Limnospira TaxID=2596745 RepID=A0A9P1KKH8_9CYAN|nr:MULTISPECIES: type II toxin-antitoxin system Phd/YefM family antitoxin [Limnospira]MDC0837246.1 type II toxin-antitoxin system Phd/YefM family antitoxin [Limnoraphis robusta]RAQ48975.1 type II toxin-antitoxin system Phd/YefM family antitoxin [Arthrospira sp. O9.13F]EDZ96120.1 prevent-host-death family protein [Limnospira maxima CS-328]QNH56815.1 MAG: type II toxin-antitoxin system Phd/YefM family antitoxin [Limnospira indica BM01]CDM97321.1 conserved hypothetical protein [Limnospira indica 
MINLSGDIHSLSDFQRHTSEFIAQMKETGKPIVLTVNGKAELVVQDAVSYQKLLDMMEYLETLAAIKQGLADVNADRTSSLAEFQQKMQEKLSYFQTSCNC